MGRLADDGLNYPKRGSQLPVLTKKIQAMKQLPDYLFIATHVTCYCYCDKTKMRNGDYMEIGRLYFSPLKLELYKKDSKYSEAHERMKQDFEKLSKLDRVQTSATGQFAKITHQ